MNNARSQNSIEFSTYPSPTSFFWILSRFLNDILQKPLTFVFLVWAFLFAVAAFVLAVV
jgi:hypothetical protein